MKLAERTVRWIVIGLCAVAALRVFVFAAALPFFNNVDEEIPFWESRLNHESGEPPLCYALAGGWMNVGRLVGLRGLPLLYWVRFLNVGIGAALVWVGFAATRSTFPDNQFLQLGVPA